MFLFPAFHIHEPHLYTRCYFKSALKRWQSKTKINAIHLIDFWISYFFHIHIIFTILFLEQISQFNEEMATLCKSVKQMQSTCCLTDDNKDLNSLRKSTDEISRSLAAIKDATKVWRNKQNSNLLYTVGNKHIHDHVSFWVCY